MDIHDRQVHPVAASELAREPRLVDRLLAGPEVARGERVRRLTD